MTLIDFLLARIAEDEADAADLARLGRVLSGPPYWPTDRFRAECEAKRRIVALHTPDHECTDGSDSYPGVMGAGMYEPYCPTLRTLALPYADHPDYREEWKP